VPDSVRNDPENVKHRHGLYEKYRNATDFVDYRCRCTPDGIEPQCPIHLPGMDISERDQVPQ
jgi:hypothetical protein